jgi:hypothetical protein
VNRLDALDFEKLIEKQKSRNPNVRFSNDKLGYKDFNGRLKK